MKLLGIYRETEYSPGRHRSNDAQLLEDIAEALRGHGPSVELTTIEKVNGRANAPAIIFSMCQGRAAIDHLRGLEECGACIVNRPFASLNTYRERLPGLLHQAAIGFPPTRFVPTSGTGRFDVNGGLWLKRGDVHAAVSADVQWVDSAERLHTALAEFRSRGIPHAALQEHQAGDEIKFYAIAGTDFFEWFHPATPVPPRFDVHALRALAARAAAAVGLEIYGGDAIVNPEGRLTLIDLNDWPSFAPCRERAARAIADYLMRRVDVAWNSGLVPSANQSAV